MEQCTRFEGDLMFLGSDKEKMCAASDFSSND